MGGPLDEYWASLQAGCDEIYEVAAMARAMGRDPRNFVEIPQAADLADRVQKLLDFLHERRTAEQIRDLEVEHDGNRERMALEIAKIVSAETFLYSSKRTCGSCNGTGESSRYLCDDCGGMGATVVYDQDGLNTPWRDTVAAFDATPDRKRESADKTHLSLAIYHGVCAGLAVLTEGILVAPLEGVVTCRVYDNPGANRPCLGISYAGPIRSAGGTGQALSVLIGDLLRREFRLDPPKTHFEEIERFKEEVSKYARGLQYRPSNPELELILGNCPIYIDGEGVGGEVTGYREPAPGRVTSPKIREGALLVLCEGMVLKAPKILKYVDALGLDGWDWLRKLVKTGGGSKGIEPSFKFISDVLAGRPVFSQPMAPGGFRLRYGRSRLAGLATTACHPATMAALSGFAIVGTQLKYERPGKGTVVTPCTEIDGPYVQFLDGSGRRINDENEIPGDVSPNEDGYPIAKVWDLGDLLVPVGEFLENNHPLAASPYVPEWHQQLRSGAPVTDLAGAINESVDLGIPLDPRFVPVGAQEVTAEELIGLLDRMNGDTVDESDLEIVYRLHVDVTADRRLVGTHSELLIHVSSYTKSVYVNFDVNGKTGLEALQAALPEILIRQPIGLRIGARMGKPEGSKHRELKPAIHCLFPLGKKVGTQRRVHDAVRKPDTVMIGWRECPECKQQGVHGVCPECGANTDLMEIVRDHQFEMEPMWIAAKDAVEQTTDLPVKGDTYLGSGEKHPEILEKGILRARNNTSTFRDGTVRFDMVDITMTHFRPDEIGISAEDAVRLGYDTDAHGNPVVSDDQVIELYPQDIVVPWNCVDGLLNVCRFVDDELKHIYDLDPIYGCSKPRDLIGQLVMGLAPHTSGAVLCRIIGFAHIKGHYGHPFFHAAKRRNCDGDIDCIMMLGDGLINFSRLFLPRTRGGRMDAPLTLTTRIVPNEVDKEALNVETNMGHYPVSFYDLTVADPTNPPGPKEALKHGVTIVEDLLGTDAALRGMGYTHGTVSCDAGPRNNPYNTLESMRQKTMAQFALGEVLAAVDNIDQVSRLIDRHLIRDMRGNLRAFGQQKIRCTKCGASYRRAPLSGRCNTIAETKTDPFTGDTVEVPCPGNLLLTVSQGAVRKYDSLMDELIDTFGCNEYIANLYRQVSKWVSETFDDPDAPIQQRLF